MKIRYSSHAVERMIARKISTQEVEEILSSPDIEIQQSRDKIIAAKRIRHRRDNMIGVVAVRLKDQFDVVTVLVNFQVKS